MAPLPALAVDLAEHVMQQHVARAGRIGAGEIADDRIEAQRGLDRFGLEPAIEDLTGALGEQVQHIATLRHAQTLEAPANLPCLEKIVNAAAHVGWSLEQQFAQHVRDAIEHRVILRKDVRVPGRESRDLGLRRREASDGVATRIAIRTSDGSSADLQITLRRQGKEVRQRALDDSKTVFGEPQIAQHPRMKQADGITGGGVSKSWMEFFGHRRAADDRTTLEHRNRKACPGQIAGAYEPVVAAAAE